MSRYSYSNSSLLLSLLLTPSIYPSLSIHQSFSLSISQSISCMHINCAFAEYCIFDESTTWLLCFHCARTDRGSLIACHSSSLYIYMSTRCVHSVVERIIHIVHIVHICSYCSSCLAIEVFYLFLFFK